LISHSEDGPRFAGLVAFPHSLSVPQPELFHYQLRRSISSPSRFDDGIAAIMERRRSLTTSDDPKISATSGSSTTATVPLDIFAANRFGFDLL
jgi:hypothetical protein